MATYKCPYCQRLVEGKTPRMKPFGSTYPKEAWAKLEGHNISARQPPEPKRCPSGGKTYLKSTLRKG